MTIKSPKRGQHKPQVGSKLREEKANEKKEGILLDRLVENALDFLDHALSEFDNLPKYSVIHFYTVVELFLKARLMAEHWSLVVSKRQDPDWKKFESGDFSSVSLDEAA